MGAQCTRMSAPCARSKTAMSENIELPPWEDHVTKVDKQTQTVNLHQSVQKKAMAAVASELLNKSKKRGNEEWEVIQQAQTK